MNAAVGIFRLIDPPPGQIELIQRAVNAIDYPWRRLLRRTWADPDGAILVRWKDTGQGTTGLFYGQVYEIHLSALERDLDSHMWVFAHEVGHLVDWATFDRETRAALTELMHRPPFVQIGHYDHDHPDAGHGSEDWRSGYNSYTSRLNEAYADLFVAAFAPDVYHGRLPGTRRHHPRFVHHVAEDELPEVRRLTLAREITVYDDVPPDHPHRDSIERAAELGLMAGKGDHDFDPNAPLTRAQAATVLVRAYDRLKAELTGT